VLSNYWQWSNSLKPHIPEDNDNPLKKALEEAVAVRGKAAAHAMGALASAWADEFGLKPSECELCINYEPNGDMRIRVRKCQKEE
jgi:hypothetical protein